MKKLICIMGIVALLAAMAGCGTGETAATDPTAATAPTQPVTEPQEEKIKLYLPVSSTDGACTTTWEYEVVEPTNSSSIMCREYMAMGNEIPVSVARRNASPYKLRVEQLTEDNQVNRLYITEYDKAGYAIRFTDRTPLADGDYSDVITEYTYNEAGIPTGEVRYEQQQEKGVLSEKVKISETAYTVEQTNEGWTVTKETEDLVKFYNDKGWLVKQTQEVFGKVTTTTYTHNEVGAVTEYTLQTGDEEPVVTVVEYAGVPVTEDVAEQFPMFCRG